METQVHKFPVQMQEWEVAVQRQGWRHFTTPTSINGATSPAARATARINPVIMAGLAIGNTVSHSVSNLVAPKAKLPSRMDFGIRAKPSSVETITTGNVSKASVIDDQSNPGVPKTGAGAASGKNSLSMLPPRI